MTIITRDVDVSYEKNADSRGFFPGDLVTAHRVAGPPGRGRRVRGGHLPVHRRQVRPAHRYGHRAGPLRAGGRRAALPRQHHQDYDRPAHPRGRGPGGVGPERRHHHGRCRLGRPHPGLLHRRPAGGGGDHCAQPPLLPVAGFGQRSSQCPGHRGGRGHPHLRGADEPAGPRTGDERHPLRQPPRPAQ